jgi:hypothetical protein
MGEGKTSGSIHTSAYYEPSSTEKDRRGTARSLGEGQSTAKEGSVARWSGLSQNLFSRAAFLEPCLNTGH